MRKHSISIAIPQPCTEQYESMKPVPGGRYCSSCTKSVRDFTAMTDAEIFRFFQNNPGDHCGKFHDSQLRREIGIIEIKRNFFQKITAVAAAAIALLLYKPAHAQLPKKIERTEQKTIPHQYLSAPVSDSILFKGQVIDEKNKPVSGAEVVLINGADGYRVYTDSSGHFKIDLTGKLDPTASLSFTYYSFTKSDLINPAYIHSPSDILIKAFSKSIQEPLSVTLGGLVLIPMQVRTEPLVNTGPYSLWDTIRKLAH